MTRASWVFVAVVSCVAPVAAQRGVPSHEPTRPAAPPVREVAKVNGVGVSSTRVDAALNALLPFESMHRGVSQQKVDELRQQALARVIDDELQYQEGVRLGVQVSEQAVEKEVAASRGRYPSQAAFDAALRESGSSVADFKRELRRTLVIAETAKREVDAKCQVARPEAKSFFDANPDRFTEPEQLHLYGITIGVDPSSSMQVWEEAKKKAEEVRKTLIAGAAFEETARNYSTDPSKAKGGDMGYFHRGSLTDEFDRVTKALPLRTASDVVQTLYGYHIIEVVDIKPSRRVPFEEVAPKLLKDMTSERCKSTKDAWLTRLRARSTIQVS